MNPIRSRFTFLTFSICLSGLIVISAGCGGGDAIEFEKEKSLYRNHIAETVSKIDRKLVVLRADYSRLEEIEQKDVSELAEAGLDVDSIQNQIVTLERIEDDLKKKRVEIDHVSRKDWAQLKSQIDELRNQYYEMVKGSEKK